MTEELQNLLARLREPGENPLSDEELATLLTGLREHADELRDAERTDEVVTTLQEVATAVGEVRAEQSTRADAATERDRQAEEALAAIGAEDEPEGGEGEGSDTPAGEGDEPTGDTPADGEQSTGDQPAETTTEAVAASARPAAPARPALGTVRTPTRQAPRRGEPAGLRATAALTAAGDLPGFSAGAEIPSADALADAMARKLRAIGAHGGSVLVASLRTEYPEERMLRGSDSDGNERKYRDAISPAALTAAGGVCGPVSVDYSIPTFASAERPVRDALVRFGADRGGVTFTPPPKIADVAGAVSIWTEATDANPSGATKAKLAIACGTPQTVLVDAVVTQLEFGNMQGRFQPESVAANTENAMAAAARVADVNLLNKIHSASTEVTLAPTVGAARGVLEVVDQALAAIRYRLRLSDQARFRAIFPRWFKDMIRADLARELANDADRMAVTDAQIDAYLSARGVNPSWHLDGVANSTTTGRTYPLQGFAAQAAGALTAWPTQVVFPLFPEGSFQFLDGGELNLGVVRDSTLNSTNDYETFIETFENVAFRGVESDWVIATLAPTGASAGTVTPANP